MEVYYVSLQEVCWNRSVGGHRRRVGDQLGGIGAELGDADSDRPDRADGAAAAPDGFGPRGLHSQAALEAAAKALGMTADELSAELWGGKTLADIAEAKGVDIADVKAAVEAAQIAETKTAINQAVTDGTITQAKADWLIEGLDKGYWGAGAEGGFGFGMGPGMGHGGPRGGGPRMALRRAARRRAAAPLRPAPTNRTTSSMKWMSVTQVTLILFAQCIACSKSFVGQSDSPLARCLDSACAE